MNATPAQRHYNPDWLSDDDLVANFVARQELFEFLRDELSRMPRQGSVQHYLLVGPRGAGKTTLLKRLAVALRRDDKLQDHLIALSFPEELYQVKHLADFWWAACDALLDELDRRQDHAAATRLEEALESVRPRGAAADPLSDAGLKLLLATTEALQRRPVLLVDNLDFVFQRIDKQGRKRKDPHAPAYWALREALSTAAAPIVIAGSVRLSEPFVDYDKAFYDFFLPKRLGKLSLNEVRRVLEHLADAQGAPEVKARLRERPSRVAALYELTGGNPRALGLIFELLRQGPHSRAVEDFERLMDLTTPYYKARFEDLAEQAQVVMHALAVHRPDDGGSLRFGHTAAELGHLAGLPTNTISAQLDVLEREGLVEKSAGKGRTQYRIAEQLFRLWLQMRGSRRIRQQVIGLTEFLEALFDWQELQAHFQAHGGSALAEARLSFALAGTRYELPSRRGLEAYGTDRLLQHAQAQGESFEVYLPAGDLPEDLAKLAGLRQHLGGCRFHGLSGAEQEALLGSVKLKPEDKEASVRKLCERATAPAEAERLRPLLAAERQRLLSLGLTEADVDLLCHKRMQGLLPLPELRPADVEGDPMVNAELRAMVWRLVGARDLVKFAAKEEARDWLKWGERRAAEAPSREWAHVAGSLRRAKQFEEAKTALDRALERGASARAWLERGAWLAETNGDIAEVEAAFRRAIELDPALAFPWNNLGNLLAVKLNRYEEAEAAYRRAIELDPADAWPWNELGVLLANQLDRPDEAEAAFARAAELDPNIHPYWQEQHLNLQTRRLTAIAREALARQDVSALQAALEKLLAESVDLPAALTSDTFVENFLAPALADGQGAEVLACLQTLGYDKHARPLLLAFEAAVRKQPERLKDVEPETQRGARLIYDRLS